METSFDQFVLPVKHMACVNRTASWCFPNGNWLINRTSGPIIVLLFTWWILPRIFPFLTVRTTHVRPKLAHNDQNCSIVAFSTITLIFPVTISMRTLTEEMYNDMSGTIQRPLIAAILPGECGSGHSVLIKIEDKYYKTYAKQTARHWILYRCKEAWSTGKCKWTGRLRKILHSEGGFHFDVIDNPKAEVHNCIPVDPSIVSSSNRFRGSAVKQNARIVNPSALWILNFSSFLHTIVYVSIYQFVTIHLDVWRGIREPHPLISILTLIEVWCLTVVKQTRHTVNGMGL